MRYMVYLAKGVRKRPGLPRRSIKIGGNRTLDDLHETILDAFDRSADEASPYSFFMGGGRLGSGRDRFGGIVYTFADGVADAAEGDVA